MMAADFVDRRAIAYAPGTRPASLIEIERAAPQAREHDGAPTWYGRGANFVVAITQVSAGTRLPRIGQGDEYMLFVPPGAGAHVTARGETRSVEPDSLTIVPPGDSEIVAATAGYLYRIFSSRAGDLAQASANAATYADASDEVAPLRDWPAPADGHRIRSYPLAEVTAGEAFGRIFRSTNLMVNIFEPYAGPRDQAALSPHSHADFEQGSLTLDGRFEHYLRAPWGKDRGTWRDDLILACGSPALTVIPAGTIHTTAWLDAGGRMIDIFAPPRADFSAHPGWVRNEGDYPTPDWVGGGE